MAIEQWEFFRRGSTRLKQPTVYKFILIFVDKNFIITVRQCTLENTLTIQSYVNMVLN